MVNVNQVFSGDTLKAEDLQGREVKVVISEYEIKKFDDGTMKPIIRFQGTEKALVCNKTNANRIATLYGDEMDDWVGRQITLYPDMVDFQGKIVPAVRVKVGMMTQPAQKAQAPLPSPAETLPANNGGGIDIEDEIPFFAESRA